MNELKYAVIGCGKVAKVHIYYLLKAGVNIVCICDVSNEELNRTKEMFNIKNIYTNYKDAIGKEKPDVVSICTPPYLHKEQAIFCAEKGIYILCEKPIATNIKDAEEIVETCEKNNVTLGVMLPRRFYNNSRAAKKALQENSLGKVKQVNFTLECNKEKEYYNTWRGEKIKAGGGVLMSQSIHSIDQLVYFFGKPVKVEGNVKTTRDYLEVEDEAQGEIEFENGIKVTLSATVNSDKTWQGITEIIGEKGKIVLDSAETPLWQVPEIQPPKPEEKENVPESIKPAYYGPGHDKVIKDFIDSIRQQKKTYVTGKNSLYAMNIIIGIYKSSENNGKAVSLREL